jgi:hypothetical protein
MLLMFLFAIIIIFNSIFAVSIDLVEIDFQSVKCQVIGDASHLSGYSFSSHNNIIHPSAQLGSRTTVSLVNLKNLTSKTTYLVSVIILSCGLCLVHLVVYLDVNLMSVGGASLYAMGRFTNG